MNAPRRRGYDHSAICYGSDDELLAVVVPFLRDGLDAGEPTVVSLEPQRVELIRAALPRSSSVTFLGTGDLYTRPATAIRSYRELMAGFVAAGATGIRIVGEVPSAALKTSWDWWARYESAVNHAYDEFPLRSMCAYDIRTTAPHVLDDVARTHPFVATAGSGHRTNSHYLDPPAFLSATRPMTPHPLQLTAPLVELTDPTPAHARQAVIDANKAGLDTTELDNLVLSVSEAVSNALMHGRPPVHLRLWADTSHMVVTVHDTGTGPDDPFAGLLPADPGGIGGLGLWLAHQLCTHVTLHRDQYGFTIRLIAENQGPTA